MNTKIHPVVAILVLLGAIGAVAGVVWMVLERRPPPLPTGPPAEMGQQMGKQNKPAAGPAPSASPVGKQQKP